MHADPQFADSTLEAFRRESLYLFLGAAFTTVGIMAAAFAALRRNFNSLLIWLAIFAIVDGAPCGCNQK